VLENGKQKPPRCITEGSQKLKSSLFIFMNFLRIISLHPFSASFFFYPGTGHFGRGKYILMSEKRAGDGL
jgi:hypothetical protein